MRQRRDKLEMASFLELSCQCHRKMIKPGHTMGQPGVSMELARQCPHTEAENGAPGLECGCI